MQNHETQFVQLLDEADRYPPSSKNRIIIKGTSLLHTELGPNCCDISEHLVLATNFELPSEMPSRLRELGLSDEEWKESILRINEALPSPDDVPPTRIALIRIAILFCCCPCAFLYQGQRNGIIANFVDNLRDVTRDLTARTKDKGIKWKYGFNAPPPGHMEYGTAWIEILIGS
eukprot:TRINITY_DN2332_c0_g1_i1.p1 TRINITY_DN2332_c0_g1~~TRINITY_DN2332_c0_g1_i1.p1  ORF type:complete len:174 (+),score=31.59 TRINITY_DN2332_c0_g1_i1:130-651(+)